VLGNFQASSTSSLRIFLRNSDLPPQLDPPSGYEYCLSEYLSIFNQLGRLDSLVNAGWVVIDTIGYVNPIDTLVGVTKRESCVNCTLGGSLKKPTYWDEE
ncbi:MAG: hypothetical protein M0P66_12560, partial [Salinivirgaceae bacterium]|nr:hypothetical protein [Salinivirgaceae bacterium]